MNPKLVSKKIDEEKKKKEDKNIPKSKLDEGVQKLVNLIFDMNLIEKSVV